MSITMIQSSTARGKPSHLENTQEKAEISIQGTIRIVHHPTSYPSWWFMTTFPPGLLVFYEDPTRGALSSSKEIPPWPLLHLKTTPTNAFPTQTSARMEKAKADQWMNGLCWRAKMAQSDHAIATLAGRSPSGEENAYVAAVASRKNLM